MWQCQGVCKPDPEIFCRAVKALGVKAVECLYVGDGGSQELYAASAMDMKAVQTLAFHELAYEPHVPCGILPDFPHILKQEELLDLLERQKNHESADVRIRPHCGSLRITRGQRAYTAGWGSGKPEGSMSSQMD